MLALALALTLVGTPQPPASPSTATTETLGAITRTDGWCTTATVTDTDAWASAPARITSSIKKAVRFVKVKYVDRTSSDDVCPQLGPATAQTSRACDLSTNTSETLQVLGEFTEWVVARDQIATRPSSPIVDPPPIWLLSSANTPKVCITIGW